MQPQLKFKLGPGPDEKPEHANIEREIQTDRRFNTVDEQRCAPCLKVTLRLKAERR